jgi:uncharacterized protein with GYD domain
MTLYIVQGCYSAEALKGMMNSPDDRSKPVAELISSLGGKMLNYYVTFGEYDFMVICEAPDEKAVAAAVIAAAAGGGVVGLRTTTAMTSQDAMGVFGQAQKAAEGFRSAGKS